MIKKEDLIELHNKYRLIIYPVLVAISSLILTAFVIFPTLLELLSDRKSSEELTSKSKILEVKAATLEVLDDSELKKNLSLALIALPSDKDLITAISSLQNIVRSSGFNILNLQVGGSLNKSSGSLGFSLKTEINGPQLRLSALLEAIESTTPIMKVGDVTISSSTSGVVSGSILVEVFYAPIQPSTPAAQSPLPELSEKDYQTLSSLNIEAPSTTGEGNQSFTLLPRGKANPFE